MSMGSRMTLKLPKLVSQVKKCKNPTVPFPYSTSLGLLKEKIHPKATYEPKPTHNVDDGNCFESIIYIIIIIFFLTWNCF